MTDFNTSLSEIFAQINQLTQKAHQLEAEQQKQEEEKQKQLQQRKQKTEQRRKEAERRRREQEAIQKRLDIEERVQPGSRVIRRQMAQFRQEYTEFLDEASNRYELQQIQILALQNQVEELKKGLLETRQLHLESLQSIKQFARSQIDDHQQEMMIDMIDAMAETISNMPSDSMLLRNFSRARNRRLGIATPSQKSSDEEEKIFSSSTTESDEPDDEQDNEWEQLRKPKKTTPDMKLPAIRHKQRK